MFRSDRPLGRRAVKLATRLLMGADRAHYHSWLPALAIRGRDADAPGQVVFRGQVPVALHFWNALDLGAPEMITIVGSGPSIAAQDLSRFGPRSTILLNGAIRLIGDAIGEPLAVAIEDERFVWRHHAEIVDRVSAGTICLFSVGVLRAFFDLGLGDWLSARRLVLIDDIRKPYGAPRRRIGRHSYPFVRLAGTGEAGLSMEPDRGVFQGGSVAISALQFALDARPASLGFAGVDIANANQPRFYETRGAMAPSGIAGAEGRILPYFSLAREIAGEKGIAIRNFSPISSLLKVGFEHDPLLQRTVF